MEKLKNQKNKIYAEVLRAIKEDEMITVGINTIVFHNRYGEGIIKKIIDNKLYVSFDGQQRIFIYPDAFEKGYLSFAAAAIKDKESDHNKDDGDLPEDKVITGVREIILDAAYKISYERIYEAINATVGTNYTGWMKACWPSNNPSLSFRIWFTKLAETQNGKLVPAAFECLNTISEDWNEFIFDDLKEGYVEGGVRYKGYSLIFAKEPDGGPYIFRGVYYEDIESSSPNHYVYKRIGTQVKLIGNPSDTIEILDDFRKK